MRTILENFLVLPMKHNANLQAALIWAAIWGGEPGTPGCDLTTKACSHFSNGNSHPSPFCVIRCLPKPNKSQIIYLLLACLLYH